MVNAKMGIFPARFMVNIARAIAPYLKGLFHDARNHRSVLGPVDGLILGDGIILIKIIKWFDVVCYVYPLISVYITMGNHHFQWVNPL